MRKKKASSLCGVPRPSAPPENATRLWHLRQKLGWTQERMSKFLKKAGAPYGLPYSVRMIAYYEGGEANAPEILVGLVKLEADLKS